MLTWTPESSIVWNTEGRKWWKGGFRTRFQSIHPSSIPAVFRQCTAKPKTADCYINAERIKSPLIWIYFLCMLSASKCINTKQLGLHKGNVKLSRARQQYHLPSRTSLWWKALLQAGVSNTRVGQETLFLKGSQRRYLYFYSTVHTALF